MRTVLYSIYIYISVACHQSFSFCRLARRHAHGYKKKNLTLATSATYSSYQKEEEEEEEGGG